MNKLEKEVVRMELQISELIRVVAYLNERIKKIEENSTGKEIIRKVPIVQKIT